MFCNFVLRASGKLKELSSVFLVVVQVIFGTV